MNPKKLTKSTSYNIAKTRREWLALLSTIEPSPFLKDASPSFRDQLLPHLPDCEPDWIVFGEFRSDLGASPIIYIKEDGSLLPLGCKHCLAGSRSYDGEKLIIAAKPAVPFSKRSTILDDFAFIIDKVLFFCPYCNRLIKDYAGDLVL
jgi:hypothetical protein